MVGGVGAPAVGRLPRALVVLGWWGWVMAQLRMEVGGGKE